MIVRSKLLAGMRAPVADILVNAFIRLHPIPAAVTLPSSPGYAVTSWRGKSAGQSVFSELRRGESPRQGRILKGANEPDQLHLC